MIVKLNFKDSIFNLKRKREREKRIKLELQSRRSHTLNE